MRVVLSLLVAVTLALVLASLASTASALATTREATLASEGDVLEDRYIVLFEDRAGLNPLAATKDHDLLPGIRVTRSYDTVVDGYAATIPDDLVETIRDDERVATVERDRVVGVSGRASGKQSLPWGIGRIDADASSTRAGNGSGSVSGVNVYVIDTGIAAHPDLNVAATAAFNATGDGKDYDCMGHGTHVAGTIAARDNRKMVVGAAPGAPLTGVKVFDCNGLGTTSGVIAGIDWVTENASRPAVANMSLGGGVSYATDQAVRNSVRSGVFYTVAAGNRGADACAMSPARAGRDGGILTVGSTTKSNEESHFSNHGECVDLWAPGSGIKSTWPGGRTTGMSGTSMAAPHAAGAAALLLSRNPSATPQAIEDRLRADADAAGTASRDGRTILRLDAGGY